MARLQQVVPLGHFGDLDAGRVQIHADWDQKAWPSNAFPFRIDGEVTRGAEGWSSLALTIQVATPYARRVVVGSFLAAIVLLGLSVAAFVALGQVGVLIGGFLGLMAAMQLATGLAPARASRRVRTDLLASLSR